MRYFLALTILTIVAFSTTISAHPGKKDKNGGHYCARDCSKQGYLTNEYHLHKIPDYSRTDWPHWIDRDGDCQDERHETLIRDNSGELGFKTTKECKVTTGKWLCPYTGRTYYLASDIDIDHIVPLKHAHNTGGANWSREKKREFANDPENMLSTEDNANQSKGYKSPTSWKPLLKSYWKAYAERWLKIKQKYNLIIPPEEMQVLQEMMDD